VEYPCAVRLAEVDLKLEFGQALPKISECVPDPFLGACAELEEVFQA
jgi:hypothetical protein